MAIPALDQIFNLSNEGLVLTCCISHLHEFLLKNDGRIGSLLRGQYELKLYRQGLATELITLGAAEKNRHAYMQGQRKRKKVQFQNWKGTCN